MPHVCIYVYNFFPYSLAPLPLENIPTEGANLICKIFQDNTKKLFLHIYYTTAYFMYTIVPYCIIMNGTMNGNQSLTQNAFMPGCHIIFVRLSYRCWIVLPPFFPWSFGYTFSAPRCAGKSIWLWRSVFFSAWYQIFFCCRDFLW